MKASNSVKVLTYTLNDFHLKKHRRLLKDTQIALSLHPINAAY
ncbi:UNVERIFIED_CONTAM: hypothetical protein GTU68_022936 [Idotea baltica]|nr:hypothetical protein [Idotea baltica]